MTDGAARLLSKHLNRSGEQQKVFRQAYNNLTSRDPSKAWTSGQWMTERTGGSDVRGTETVATLAGVDGSATDAHGLPLGPYSISGFKWFSSATDSNMTVVLAQTPKGLTAFMAPMRRSIKTSRTGLESELNGITIQRLKPKLGTTPVPTAELVLNGTRAWMIGTEGAGVREISTVLNITRVYTGLGSIGHWGRGLAIARAFTRVRKVDGGKSLADMPAHLSTMAQNIVNYAAMAHLGFFVAMLLGITEQPETFGRGTPERANGLVADVPEAIALFRLLTAVMKAQCSKMAIHGLQECMEALGGVGYLEDEQQYNIARLFRDCNVNAIWEGTTDVMAWDIVRVVKGREGSKTVAVFKAWANRNGDQWKGTQWEHTGFVLKVRVRTLCDIFASCDSDELKYRGRWLLEELAWIAATISLVTDALKDDDEVASAIAERWAGVAEDPLGAVKGVALDTTWQDASKMDKKIVFPKQQNRQARL
jgi:alkylation response protein AidB-like acyl-CoA dehydrogenase